MLSSNHDKQWRLVNTPVDNLCASCAVAESQLSSWANIEQSAGKSIDTSHSAGTLGCSRHG